MSFSAHQQRDDIHNDRAILVRQGSAAVSGDNTLIGAPGAGRRIVVAGFVMQNESATARTMRLYDGAANQGFRVLGQNQGDGLAWQLPAGREWKLPENTALLLNLDGATQCGWTVMYWIESSIET